MSLLQSTCLLQTQAGMEPKTHVPSPTSLAQCSLEHGHTSVGTCICFLLWFLDPRHSLGWMGIDSVHFSLTRSHKELPRRCCPVESALPPAACRPGDVVIEINTTANLGKKLQATLVRLWLLQWWARKENPGKLRQTSAPPLPQYISLAFLTFW